ncbi:signal peptide, CUB and EGF-like domain-containing protein 1 isoform X3 [Anneissia japonica]|uniref:signal peptide, CUB and EGF-like domain-containing protein 1 isoform X3 n=1 Tax=Anneissia japonica TaxID=1529436 RepID=UPI0014254FFC|nr:signal peptide, CUB and EGF-like domain-containing protein 1 isoform X3 [Anneissia japonica]
MSCSGTLRLALFLTVFLPSSSRREPGMRLNLRSGNVTGSSDCIQVIVPPVPSNNKLCDRQAVIKVDFSGLCKSVKFVLLYGEAPTSWTVDISDSQTGDGYGGSRDQLKATNIAETQIFGRQMRIYSNSLPGHTDATIDGGLLLKVIDNIAEEGSRLTLHISDERIQWNNHKTQKGVMNSKYLYTLSGQEPLFGEEMEYNIYAGFNRVPGGTFRSGTGLCEVNVYPSTNEGSGGGEVTAYTPIFPGVDECNVVTNDGCSENETCIRTTENQKCSCKRGFRRTRLNCQDIDECSSNEDEGCVHRCVNVPGSYYCACFDGFVLAEDGKNCVDKDECALGVHGCQDQCVNTIGRYECVCNNSYLNEDGRTCSDDPGCVNRDLHCVHYCVDTSAGSICQCRAGYSTSLNRKNCIPKCSLGNGGCQHICVNSPPGPICSCHPGYNLNTDGQTCIETCGLNNGGCLGKCTDTDGGVECSCQEGFRLQPDNRSCKDIDECLINRGGCTNECRNKIGGYECICPKGFILSSNKKSCVDVNECDEEDTCEHTCINTDGSFYCLCNQGYQAYGITHCGDMDECSVNNGGCEHNCVNLPGRHYCTCNRNFKLHPNGKDCVEWTSCLPLRTPPKTVLDCKNSVGYCTITCNTNSYFSTSVQGRNTFVYRCNKSTQFEWYNNDLNRTMPSCSEAIAAPTYKRKASFNFAADRCRSKAKVTNRFQETLNRKLSEIYDETCTDHCQVNSVELRCTPNRKKRTRRGDSNRSLVIKAEFEIQIIAREPTESCNIDCVTRVSERTLKRTVNELRKSINRKHFKVDFNGKEYEVIKRSLLTEKMEMLCNVGKVMVAGKCVACSMGTYYDKTKGRCTPCPSGTYQDTEGKMECILCPSRRNDFGIIGARNVTECGGQCRPGDYSKNGFQPCSPCPIGHFQPEPGRASCRPCGGDLITADVGSASFQLCQVKDNCQAGKYYDIATHQCQPCRKGFYQNETKMNYCVRCPGNTTTDSVGADDVTKCKSHQCGGVIGPEKGFIESPNYPGDYPTNVECVWTILPPSNRRILIVLPEIYLPSKIDDRCEDFLVMRRTESPHSTTTFETCETYRTPLAFTAKTRKLWIQFKSNEARTAKGFRIPYVTYEEEYEYLIEDIVRDGRLYSSDQHQAILQDRKVVSALLEVCANPQKYYQYNNEYRSILPASFVRFLETKIERFLVIPKTAPGRR